MHTGSKIVIRDIDVPMLKVNFKEKSFIIGLQNSESFVLIWIWRWLFVYVAFLLFREELYLPDSNCRFLNL